MERIERANERLEQEMGDLEADKAALEEEVRNLNFDHEAERKQAVVMLAKERKALQREIDRLTGEIEEADAKITQAQAEAAAAQAAALEAVASHDSSSAPEGERRKEKEEIEVEEDVRQLQEENAVLHREIETYRELAASQDLQFSLVYIQEVNTYEDYLVIENRTNLDGRK
eukprot:evm.model.NODE_3106_length_7779_cov_20.765137.4